MAATLFGSLSKKKEKKKKKMMSRYLYTSDSFNTVVTNAVLTLKVILTKKDVAFQTHFLTEGLCL